MTVIFSQSHYHRRPEFQIQTQLIALDQDFLLQKSAKLNQTHQALYQKEQFYFQKKALHPLAQAHLEHIFHIYQNLLKNEQKIPLATTTYQDQILRVKHYNFPNLLQLTENHVLNKEFKSIFNIFDHFFCTILLLNEETMNPYENDNFVQTFDTNLKFKKQKAYLCISAGIFDLIASNILLNSQSQQTFVIDQEWQIDAPLPLDFVKFHFLHDLCSRLQPTIKSFCSDLFPCFEFSSDFLIPISWLDYFNLDRQDIPAFYFWQQSWQNTISFIPQPIHNCLVNTLLTPFNSCKKAHQGQLINYQTKTIKELQLKLAYEQSLNQNLRKFPLNHLMKIGKVISHPTYYWQLFITREKLFIANYGKKAYPDRISNYLLKKIFLYRISRTKDKTTPHRFNFYHFLARKTPTAKNYLPSSHTYQSSKNILIIAGAPGTVSHIHRVDHLIQQFHLLNYDYRIITHRNLAAFNPQHLLKYNLIYIHRATGENIINAVIDFCQLSKIPIIYDVDDLVFDPEIINQISTAQNLASTEMKIFQETTFKHQEIMQKITYFATPTQFLNDYIQKLLPQAKTFLIPNHLDQLSFEKGMKLAQKKLQTQNEQAHISRFNIGYFPGTKTHDADFLVCAPAIKTLLDKYPQAKLIIVGELTLPTFLSKYLISSQIIQKPRVPYSQLINQYDDIDFNIVPLEENAFCQSKSELKYFFAGICGIPTLATATAPFKDSILRNQGGDLCFHPDEWFSKMEFFLQNPTLLLQAAQAAYQDCQETYSPLNQAKILKKQLESIME